jgi:putative phosphonate catabolism associated alcohol dehydrogenase
MTTTTHAMVFEGPGRPLVARQFSLPKLEPGELLVEVACTTICGSDLHTYQGRRQTPCPTILGHEILGRVANLPPGPAPLDLHGRPVALGDRITWSIAASCGDCFNCAHGLPQKCDSLFKYGHEPIASRHSLSGGLAEHCHLARGTALVRLPDHLPDAAACPLNCATATVAAALRVAGDCRGATVLVQGAGMLGLTAAAMASARGAAQTIICDVDESRLRSTANFGATMAIHLSPGTNELAAAVRDATHGRGVDIALELSGSPDAIEAGLPLLRIGGRYVLVGSVFPTRDVRVQAETMVRRLLRIEGLHNYTPADLAAAVEFMGEAHHRHPFAELVTASFPLDSAEAAFEYAIANRSPRVAVVPRS